MKPLKKNERKRSSERRRTTTETAKNYKRTTNSDPTRRTRAEERRFEEEECQGESKQNRLKLSTQATVWTKSGAKHQPEGTVAESTRCDPQRRRRPHWNEKINVATSPRTREPEEPTKTRSRRFQEDEFQKNTRRQVPEDLEEATA